MKSSSRLFFFLLLFDSRSGFGGLIFNDIFSAVFTSFERSFRIAIQSISSTVSCLSKSKNRPEITQPSSSPPRVRLTVEPDSEGGDQRSDAIEEVFWAGRVVGVEVRQVLLELPSGQPVDHFKAGEPVLGRVLHSVLQLVHLQLKLDVEGVEEVAPEDYRVDRSVDGVDPPSRDEDGLTLLELQLVTFIHHVTYTDH